MLRIDRNSLAVLEPGHAVLKLTPQQQEIGKRRREKARYQDTGRRRARCAVGFEHRWGASAQRFDSVGVRSGR